LTGAALATGTVTGILALKKSSTYKDPSTPRQDLQGLKDSGELFKTLSTITFAAGAGLAAISTVLLVFTDFGSKERSISAAPTSGGGMIFFGGSYE
jgi:hypothetical protein